MSLTALMQQFVGLREQLEKHGVRDTGDYAELLVCSALRAQRNENRVTRGFDIQCVTHGRVEVRSRTLPRDGRNETRLEIPIKKIGHFDSFAGVLFDANLMVIGGFLLPHDATTNLAGRQKHNRVPFQLGAKHQMAKDITGLLKDAQATI